MADKPFLRKITLRLPRALWPVPTAYGHVIAFDDNGKVLWQSRVGRGGPLGGVHWGMSFAGDIVYVPVSDRSAGGAENMPRQPGLHAIAIECC